MSDCFFHDINDVPLKDGTFVLFLPDYSTLRGLIYGIILGKKIITQCGILYHSTNIYGIKYKTDKEKKIYKSINKVRNKVIRERKLRGNIKFITPSHCKPFRFYRTLSGEVFLYIGFGTVDKRASGLSILFSDKIIDSNHGHIFCLVKDDNREHRYINADSILPYEMNPISVVKTKRFSKELSDTTCSKLRKKIKNKKFRWDFCDVANLQKSNYVSTAYISYVFTLK